MPICSHSLQIMGWAAAPLTLACLLQVLVCTLSMLCSPRLQRSLLHNRCALRLLVDEASQVYVGDYLVHLHRHGSTLR